MRALVVASIAASLLFTNVTPSSAGKFKAYLDALVDMQKEEEGKDIKTQPTRPDPKPSKPKGK